MRTRVVWLTAVLLIGFIGFSPSHAQEGENLLVNGGFEDGVATPWGTYGGATIEVVETLAGAAVPEDPIEGRYCLHVVVPVAGADYWNVGLYPSGVVFEQGKKYTFSAFLKCKTGTLQIEVKPELNQDPWTAYGVQTFTMTEEWVEYSTTTPVFTEDVSPPTISLHIGFAAAEFWIDGARWYEGDYVAPKVFPELATEPSPEDGASDVPQDVVMSWKPGAFADKHNVYFGDNFDDINNADITNPLGVLVSPGQDPNTFDPDGLLEFEQTYYWRIDEVNAPPDSTIFKGNVWSFTVEPYAYPIENITAASSSSSVNMEPDRTVDGSGLNDSDQHSTDSVDMWLSNMAGPQPTWIQYEFDKAYKVYEMWVWNSNQTVEAFIGFGAKDVTIEHSEDGVTWTALGDVELARAPGTADYAHNTTVDFGGALAKYVRINPHSNWGGITPQYGLSEVRFFYIPVYAREPRPASGSKGMARDIVLDWRTGRGAVSHEISISSDEEAVINGTAPVDVTTESRYQPGTLDFGQTYYWKVNEVNDTASPSVWEGDVWSFSTIEYFVVEGFEDYNDYPPDEIFNTWIDGYGTTTNGSTAGYPEPDFLAGEHYVETTIVHGGSQSMPLFYDNNFKYSEAAMTLVSERDWTVGSAAKLLLWFRGEPNNAAEPMYIALNGGAVVYHDDPGAAQIDTWTQWTIDLSKFADQGVNLTNVNTIAIGFGDKNNLQAGGSGMVFFDDIRVGNPMVLEPPEGIWLEAEAAETITSPMKTYDDPLASGGKYIGTDDGIGDEMDATPADGVATYNFTAQGGTYKIEFSVIITGGSNSFWVRIPSATDLTPGEDPDQPGSGWVRFNDISDGAEWHWDEVRSSDHGDAVANWTLAAGAHTLEIARREDGTLLDVIVISKID